MSLELSGDQKTNGPDKGRPQGKRLFPDADRIEKYLAEKKELEALGRTRKLESKSKREDTYTYKFSYKVSFQMAEICKRKRYTIAQFINEALEQKIFSEQNPTFETTKVFQDFVNALKKETEAGDTDSRGK